MQRGSAVEEHRTIPDDLLQYLPHFRALAFDQPLGRLDIGRVVVLHEALDHEGAVELQRHGLRQAALVYLKLRAHHDDRAPGVVHALTQQIPAEAPFLSLEHVAQRTQLTPSAPAHGLAALAVVDEAVHCLLQHPLLVMDDDLGGAQVEEPLETIVAVDDAPVEVVEVGGGEASAIELDHGTQLGREDREDGEYHPFGAIVALAEGLDDAKSPGGLLAPLHGAPMAYFVPELLRNGLEIDSAQDIINCLGSHACLEDLPPFLAQLAIAGFVEKLQGGQPQELFPLSVIPIADGRDLFLELLSHTGDLFFGHTGRQRFFPADLTQGFLFSLSDFLLQGIQGVLGHSAQGGVGVPLHNLAGFDNHCVGGRKDQRLGGFTPHQALQSILKAPSLAEDGLGPLVELGLEALSNSFAIGFDGFSLLGQLSFQLADALLCGLFQQTRALFFLLVQALEGPLPGLLIHADDDVLGEIEHPVEVALTDVDEDAEVAGYPAGVPDVGYGRGEGDVPHAFPAHRGTGHFDAALVADDAPVTNTLVFTTVALVITAGAEDGFTEKTIFLWTQTTVVDGLRLGDLSVGPGEDIIR